MQVKQRQGDVEKKEDDIEQNKNEEGGRRLNSNRKRIWKRMRWRVTRTRNRNR